MPKAHLVRHGETEWNVLGRYQGHADSALTARGLAQIDAVAAKLALGARERPERIVASDLGRAMVTARGRRDTGFRHRP